LANKIKFIERQNWGDLVTQSYLSNEYLDRGAAEMTLLSFMTKPTLRIESGLIFVKTNHSFIVAMFSVKFSVKISRRL